MGLFSKLFSQTKATVNQKYNPKASNYKLDTLEDIESIPVPTKNFQYNCDFTESIEYVLQRKATQFKKEGKMDLAIACLRKSNEIMPFAPMAYTKKDYARLESYLKLAGKFDEARELKKESHKFLSNNKDLANAKIKNILSSGTDMIEVQRHEKVCSECAKYHGRIYSKHSKHGYPDIEIFLDYYNNKSCSCYLSFYPFFYKVSTPNICSPKNAVKYSNRPFLDDRTESEKLTYNEYINEQIAETKDRTDYDWICEYLSDIAPKSFGGYRNMKNKNSMNYQKIVSAAKEKGYLI